jgi:hypothetical protein
MLLYIYSIAIAEDGVKMAVLENEAMEDCCY